MRALLLKRIENFVKVFWYFVSEVFLVLYFCNRDLVRNFIDMYIKTITLLDDGVI